MTSISFHVGGNSSGNVAIEHNNRTLKKHKNRDIDVSKSAQNIQFKKSKSVKDAYNQIFEPYTEKYDKKQKRNDRKIGNYYDHLSHQKGGKGGQKDRNLVYESISTVGKTDFENGKPKPFTQKELDFKKQVLKKAEEGWSEAHPNMIVINSVMHLDESNPHIHRDFVPVFHSKTGQELQVSLNKAIAEELGVSAKRVPVRKLNKKTGKYEQVFYKNGKLKIKLDNKANFKIWSERERNRIAEIARTIDSDFERTKTDEVDHQSVAEYKEVQAAKNLEESENLKTKLKRERIEKIIDKYSDDSSPVFWLTNEDGEVITEEDESDLYSVPVEADFEVNSDESRKYLKKATDKQLEFYEGYFEKSRELDFENEKKLFNCEMIREYEPEARVTYKPANPNPNSKPKQSEPIKEPKGFEAFMDRSLEWLKKERDKYAKKFREKLAQFKKEKAELDKEREAVKQEKQEATKLKNEFSIYGNFELGDTIEQKYEYNENLGWYRKTGSGRLSEMPINLDKTKLKPNDFIKYEKRTKTVSGKIIGYSNYDENDNLNNFIILQSDKGKKEKVVLNQGGSPKLVKKCSAEEREEAISNEIKENKPLSKFPNEAIEQAQARKYEMKRSGQGMSR